MRVVLFVINIMFVLALAFELVSKMFAFVLLVGVVEVDEKLDEEFVDFC